jgi:hypothetical protein
MAARSKSKKPSTRKHEVKAELANFHLAKAKSALKLEIYSRGEKVGEIQLGRGSLYWWGKQRHLSKRINWERFTEMMNQLAYGEKG